MGNQAFRMAGIRCGFAAGCKRLTDALRAVKSPYNVSSLTQAAAEAILSRPFELHSAAWELESQRDDLSARLTEIAEASGAFRVVPSCANFVYLVTESEESAGGAFEYLKERGIIIRRFGSSLRVTAGTHEEQRLFTEAFAEYFPPHGGCGA